jgi:hypothetical protein
MPTASVGMAPNTLQRKWNRSSPNTVELSDSWAEGPWVHPVQGNALGTKTTKLEIGPTGHSFAEIRGELLVRWTDQRTIRCVLDPQGVALGWVNGSSFGADNQMLFQRY